MTHTEALSKAAKLLKLAQSSNPHEAALAASRAQEIMDRFSLTSDTVLNVDAPIESREPINHFAADPLDVKTDRWRGQLSMCIAALNACKLYHAPAKNEIRNGQWVTTEPGGLVLIGRASDVMTCRYIYGWLAREIDRLAETHCAGNGRTYWNNFRLGAVETVCQRLRAQHSQTIREVTTEANLHATPEANNRALLIVNTNLARIEKTKAEVETYGKEKLKLCKRSASRTNYNPNAREAGRQAGKAINLNGARGAIGAGHKAIGGY